MYIYIFFKLHIFINANNECNYYNVYIVSFSMYSYTESYNIDLTKKFMKNDKYLR